MIIDAALVLVDGKGNTNIMDMGAPTTGGHNSLSGWLNIRTSGTSGSVKIQECDTEAGSYTDVANGTYAFSAAGKMSVPFPKTSKRFVKATLTTLTASNTEVVVGGLMFAKEIA